MKLVKKSLEKDGYGTLSMIPEEAEDLWHVYNLLQPPDLLKATTIRRVVTESNTGSTAKSSHKITLTIQVESLFFDTQAATLRVNGRNVEENKFVKMGGFHTLDLELHRVFTITKECWDFVHLDRIETCCDISKKADIAAVVLQEGLAQICLLTENMTVVKLKVESNVPKKRRGTTTDHDKGMSKFFDQVYQGICQHVNFELIKVLIIASPGFYKDALYKYIIDEALKTQFKPLLDNRAKIILAHSSSGHKHALGEILQDPGIQSRLSDTKYAQETSAIENFYKVLGSDDASAFYGYEFVEKASEMGAVETLMVTDGLFRSSDLAVRKKYIKLVEKVKESGGKVLIFSSMHNSGEQLAQLTGIAAILYFPMPDLEQEVEDEMERKRVGNLVRDVDLLAVEDPSVEM